MSRLSCLLLMSNSISKISGNSSLCTNLSNLTSLILSNNNISQLTEIYNLAGFKKLEMLSLVDNPVSLAANYRKYVIVKLPSLKTLDFVKVKKEERAQALLWAKSAEGRACIAQVQADAITRNAASSGAGGSAGAGGGIGVIAAPSLVAKVAAAPVKRVYTDDEKAQIRAAIEKASSPEEMDIVERQLKVGGVLCLFWCCL
jgi:U2 small nuclear ribonucleoprotein A'